MFFKANGAMTELESLVEARDMNNAGQLVGLADFGSGDHAVIYENGRSIDLNGLVTRTGDTVLRDAFDINNKDRILARSDNQG